jgi:hypothetical protein
VRLVLAGHRRHVMPIVTVLPSTSYWVMLARLGNFRQPFAALLGDRRWRPGHPRP